MGKSITKTYTVCVIYTYDDGADITGSNMNVAILREKIKKAIAGCLPVGQGRINAQIVGSVSET